MDGDHMLFRVTAVIRRGLGALPIALIGLVGCREPVFVGGGGGDGGAAGSGETTTSDSSGGAGGSGGGTTTSTDDGQLFPDPPEGSYPCGPQGYCLEGTYCLMESPGVCCEGPYYTCVPLPVECQTEGATCSCFDGTGCPCPGVLPEQCGQLGIVSVDCSYVDATGTFEVTCGYP